MSTMDAQDELEEAVSRIYGEWLARGGGRSGSRTRGAEGEQAAGGRRKERGGSGGEGLRLLRERHVRFLLKGLDHLSSSYASLDASRPWLVFWIVHSLALLEHPLDASLAARCADTLRRCQNPEGGFGGGPGQLAHLATTYAAVAALVTVGGEEALSVVNRKSMLAFLRRMKCQSGGFRLHQGGETDVRGCYTAMAVAHLLCIPTPDLSENVAAYVHSCQTYEGGIGGEPGAEAHGGIAAPECSSADSISFPLSPNHLLPILCFGHNPSISPSPLLPSHALQDWLVFRQGSVEGGFQGRSNKLVDACYSLWQGGLFPLLALCSSSHTRPTGDASSAQQPSKVSSVPRTEGAGGEQQGMQADNNGEERGAVGEPSGVAGCSGQEKSQEESGAQERSSGSEGGGGDGRGGEGAEDEEDEEEEDEEDEWEEADVESFHRVPLAAAADLFPCPESLLPPAGAGEGGERTGGERGGGEERGGEGEEGREGAAGAVRGESGDRATARGGSDWVGSFCYNDVALQAYLLLCCQMPEGGLRDKPGKARDYYHTCYALSGLTAAQHSHPVALPTHTHAPQQAAASVDVGVGGSVLGPVSNFLAVAEPRCNVRRDKYDEAILFYEESSGLRSIRYAKEIPGVGAVVALDNDPVAGLAASGLRSIRYAKEIPGVGAVVALDNDPVAVQACQRNVDLDPYGTPSVFLDGAVQAVADGGMLLVTATDMAVLCGNNAEVCYSKYGAYPHRAKYCHEMAIRILLASIESAANRFKRHIVPVLSVSVDFYIRVFVRVFTSAQAVKATPSKLAHVFQCSGCDSYHLQPVGRVVEGRAKKPDAPPPPPRYLPGLGPVIPPACEHCGRHLSIGGPMWSAPIHDASWVRLVLGEVQAGKGRLAGFGKVHGLLTAVSEELHDIPLYLDLHEISATLKCTPPSMLLFRSALVNAGHRVSGAHSNPLGIKTDAPLGLIWDVMRCWIRDHPVKSQGEGSPADTILAKPPTTEVNFAKAPKALSKAQQKGVARFVPNPEAYWGPKPRAGRKDATAMAVLAREEGAVGKEQAGQADGKGDEMAE
ncbi:unnamed protein product [Closterium sp. NIES-65]|nr:unnamed protein product [Closterium sp. NIES-65]